MFDYFSMSMFYLLVPVIVIVIVVVAVVAFINNRNNTNNMDPNQMKPKASAKDFFLNLGAFVALYTLLGNLLALLFTVIDTAYPKITNGYNYNGSSSISLPVATLVVLLPVFLLLMWFLEKEYRIEEEMQNSLIHRGLTYITLFISGCVIAGDLITVVYYFIDGQELTTGFLLKVLVLLVISSSLFIYYISDLRKKLTTNSRIFWRIIAGVIVVGSILWGFAVLGSPLTQRLIKYDEQKVTDLENINGQVQDYFYSKQILPQTLSDLSSLNYYSSIPTDQQTNKPYEYIKANETSYELCAEFNKDSKDSKNNLNYPARYQASTPWVHPAGHYCFKKNVTPPTSPYQMPITYPPIKSIY